MTIETKGPWARLLTEAAERYYAPAEWAALTPDRQALELAKMDDGDAWTQAGIVAQAEGAKVWAVVLDWTARGLMGPLGQRWVA